MSNSQNVVIVAGASQDIGAELVKGFRQHNYRIVAVARSFNRNACLNE